jgi:hypothetical protein
MRVDRPVCFSVSLSLDVHDREREHFLAVAGRLVQATAPAELETLREELARLTFGN